MQVLNPKSEIRNPKSSCVHCGLCLEHCPTYLATGMETESPRGRLHLIAALADGRIQATERYAAHLELCLQCRACEAACPSGVPFGRIMEQARHELLQQRPPATGVRLLRWLALQQLFPRLQRLRLLAEALRLYQRSGLQAAVRRSGLLRALAPRLAEADAMLPSLPGQFFSAHGQVFPAVGETRRRVGFFSGCVMPLLYARVHAATIRVLTRNGCEVVVVPGQGCCGALNLHAGERSATQEMARRNVEAFLAAGVEAVVVNAAGCGATLKEYPELLEHDADVERVQRFAALVQDVHEFLAALPLERPTGRLPLRVTLQESCHLSHAQRLKEPPRVLLAAIPGLELVDMPHPDRCCGSAGLYSLVQAEMSKRLLETRLAEIRATGAQVVATSNPGCMLQLESGLRRAGLPVAVKHVVELLDEAYR